jgi:radical SAM superfamily enzyme YgiQ (UPF0313 family)
VVPNSLYDSAGRLIRPSLNISLIEPRAPGVTVFDLVKLPRLGIVLLATQAKKVAGVNVDVRIEQIEPLDLEEISKSDLIGVSTTTSTAPRAYAICDEIRLRNPKAVVILGGVHVTFNQEEALEHCDHVFIGEADLTFPAFVEDLMKGIEQPRVIGKRLRDGFNLPLRHSAVDHIDFVPDLTLIRGWQRMRIAPVVTSRSCPFSCTFCSVIEMFGQRMRFASLESVRENLENAHRLGFRNVFFYDDNFVVDVKRTDRLLQLIHDLNFKFRWSAQVRANTFANRPELAQAMHKAGCRMVYVGIESSEPTALLAFNKRANVAEMTRGVQNLRKAGILVHGMFVAGAATDTKESIRKSLRFAIRQRLSTVQFMVLTPLPGTQDHDRLERSGRVFDRDWSHYDAHHTVHHPEGMSAQRLEKETMRAMRKFYSLWRIPGSYRENLFHFNQAFSTMCLRAFGWAHIKGAIRELRSYTSHLPNNQLTTTGANSSSSSP